MNYIIAAAFVILCGQTVPEPMTLTDAVTYVDTHPKERFLTEKEVMALGLTKRVWSISSCSPFCCYLNEHQWNL